MIFLQAQQIRLFRPQLCLRIVNRIQYLLSMRRMLIQNRQILCPCAHALRLTTRPKRFFQFLFLLYLIAQTCMRNGVQRLLGRCHGFCLQFHHAPALPLPPSTTLDYHRSTEDFHLLGETSSILDKIRRFPSHRSTCRIQNCSWTHCPGRALYTSRRRARVACRLLRARKQMILPFCVRSV